MANTGAVMVRVVRKIASMPGRTLVGVVSWLMISQYERVRVGNAIQMWELACRRRSELAREKLPGAAFIQLTRVIVGVFREQARSYRVSAWSQVIGAGLNSVMSLCSLCRSAQVCFLPLATSR